jgi:hypothetical protein
MWDSNVFGSAYAIKITMNNASVPRAPVHVLRSLTFSRMNIIVRVITGRIQDADNNSYDRVTIVYVILAGCSVVVSMALIFVSWKTVDLRHLQWSRKKRITRGTDLNERKDRFYGLNSAKNMRISLVCFGSLVALVLGSWCGYFWGVATGNNN